MSNVSGYPTRFYSYTRKNLYLQESNHNVYSNDCFAYDSMALIRRLSLVFNDD